MKNDYAGLCRFICLRRINRRVQVVKNVLDPLLEQLAEVRALLQASFWKQTYSYSFPVTGDATVLEPRKVKIKGLGESESWLQELCLIATLY
jgi:hypothetical protein